MQERKRSRDETSGKRSIFVDDEADAESVDSIESVSNEVDDDVTSVTTEESVVDKRIEMIQVQLDKIEDNQIVWAKKQKEMMEKLNKILEILSSR